MNVSEHHIPVKIAVIGGGSLNWAMTLMGDLASDTRLAAEVRLYDTDHAAAERNARIGARMAEFSRGVPARYTACSEIGEALDGANIVVISILPGDFASMAQDIAIPAQFGIRQSVGDTVGPGGFVRAMRAIPMLAEIGRAIVAHAPEAYVCNLTNPMSVLTGALYAAFPAIKAWGECHEVTKLRYQVAHIANEEAGAPRWSHRDVEVNVLGVNHFTFVDRIALDGRDMMPAYRAFVAAHREAGWAQAKPGENKEHDHYFGSRNLVSFDLERRFGLPAAAGDRHLAEFVAQSDYLTDPARWGFTLTPVEYRMRERARKAENAEALARGEGRLAPKRSDEALVDQIAGLMGGGAFVSNVNLPNRGQIANLPAGAVVESNAVFSSLGITPVLAGELPEGLETLIGDHARRQSALLAAVMEGDRPALLPLFRSDPQLAGLSDKDTAAMFDAMCAATAVWLPQDLKGAA